MPVSLLNTNGSAGIDTVLTLGDDALVNQFIINIEAPSVIKWKDNYSMRCDTTFDPPSQQIGTYEIQCRGEKITRTGRQRTTEKTFTLPIRCDQAYAVYDAIMAWINLSFSMKDGKASPDKGGSDIRGKLIIIAANTNNEPVKVFTYMKAKPTQCKLTSFDNSGEGPQRIETTWIYGWLENDPIVPNGI